MDVTLRAALIESRQRMKELLELSCDFAWETDANGLFSFVTSGGALGHETLDLLGSDPADLVLSPEDGRYFQADSPPEGLLVWAGTKTGTPRCLHLKARAVFDQQGEFLCVRGACRDVTPEQDRDLALAAAKHRERSLIQLFRALRQAADPKAAMELGVATAAQATGAAGAVLCAVRNDEPGDPIAQAGVSFAAPSLARQVIADRQAHRSLSPGRRLRALEPARVRFPSQSAWAERSQDSTLTRPMQITVSSETRTASSPRTMFQARARDPARVPLAGVLLRMEPSWETTLTRTI